MKLAIVANAGKYEVKEVLQDTMIWADQNEARIFMSGSAFEETKLKPTSVLELTESDVDAIKQSQVVLVMGGDGTILYTARISREIGKPILGINSGRLGFMANTQTEELEEALNCLLANSYTLDKRTFLKASDNKGNTHYALNEFLFTRKDSTSMVNITAKYGNSLINTYWADGLIVSSPTGSTAYSLASGGPIVSPGTDVFLVTPVNPHTLTTRPLVVSTDKPIHVIVEEQQSEILFSNDGQSHEIHELPFEVEIVQSDLTFNLVQLPGHDYFETLRKKLMWGMDSRRIRN